MSIRMVTMAAAAAFAALGAAAGEPAPLFPFVISYDSPENAANVSRWLDAPAGRHGRVRVAGGHFVTDAGRIRFHATNLTGPANFPTHAEADRLAARLARFGLNCVRLHYFDADYGNFMEPAEPGIIARDFATRRRLDPERRDRQDYLVAALKKRGIYVNINLHIARTLDARDGVAPGTPWANKGVDAFDPWIIRLEREYARDLLAHVNPYTGFAYTNEPAVAMVELNNEDSILTQYAGDCLDALREPYGTELRTRWNAWLLAKYGNAAAAAAALGPGAAKPEEIAAGAFPVVGHRARAGFALKRAFWEFLTATERAYWTPMRRYLVEELHLAAPVTGTQLGYTPPHLMAELDYVDNHAYWNHPGPIATNWAIWTASMVNSLVCVRNLAVERVAGKPYTVSEYNHPYPQPFGAEGQPILRAIGAFQGWDGVFEYTYNHRALAEPDHNTYFFSMVARTDVLAHMPACAAMFLRGDVAEGPDGLAAPMPFAGYLDRLTKRGAIGQGIVSLGYPADYFFLRRVAVDVSAAAATTSAVPPAVSAALAAGALTNGTGQLVWNREVPGAGFFLADTPNTKLFTGFPKGRAVALGGVGLAVGETRLGWATVSLTSLDATGFGEGGRPARILLAATGVSQNSGAVLTPTGKGQVSCRGADWGRGPVMNEGVPAVVTLPAEASRVSCWALDEAGNRREAVPAEASGPNRAAVVLGPRYRTVWYELAVRAR